MGTITCPEIREIELSPLQTAKARDAYVRSFDRQYQDWAEIGKCCLIVKNKQDWKLLGFHSFEAWLIDAAPASRRFIYYAMGLVKSLAPDIPAEELAEISMSTAKVLREMSPGARRNPKVRKAAIKRKTVDFVKEVQSLHPEQHIERRVRKIVEFSESAWSVVDATYEKFCVVMQQPDASLADFIEWLCSEVSDWTLHADKDHKGRKDDSEERLVH